MAGKKELQRLAEGMFIEQCMTAKAIAEILGVTEKTVGNWREKGDWDRRRDENIAAPHKIRELLLKELHNVATGVGTTIDADALAKIGKVMDSISDKISPQVVISVLKSFDNWMADQEPQIAVQFLEYHKRFIQHIISLHD